MQHRQTHQENIEESERDGFLKTQSLSELINAKGHRVRRDRKESTKNLSVETVKDLNALKLEQRNSLQLSMSIRPAPGFLGSLTQKASTRKKFYVLNEPT
jgi:hypothetical protein